MQVTTTALAGVLLIEPTIYRDARGLFFETHSAARYREAGLPLPFVQDNYSRSQQGVLRGLHYQLEQPQGKLVWPTRGKIFDVVLDVQRDSPTFGQWLSFVLDADAPQQLYIPPGFAHGFCVLSAEADFFYKCTAPYAPTSERGVHWQDPALAIPWPVTAPVVSTKDAAYPPLRALAAADLLTLAAANGQ